jgi:hypothetical protein
MRVIDRVVRENNLPCSSLEYSKESVCDACQQGKIHQLAFPKSISVSMVSLELIHSDVWGPAPTYIGRKIIMLALLMISANSHGFISFATNLKFFKSFICFKGLLTEPLIARSWACKPTRVVSTKNSIPSLLV